LETPEGEQQSWNNETDTAPPKGAGPTDTHPEDETAFVALPQPESSDLPFQAQENRSAEQDNVNKVPFREIIGAGLINAGLLIFPGSLVFGYVFAVVVIRANADIAGMIPGFIADLLLLILEVIAAGYIAKRKIEKRNPHAKRLSLALYPPLFFGLAIAFYLGFNLFFAIPKYLMGLIGFNPTIQL